MTCDENGKEYEDNGERAIFYAVVCWKLSRNCAGVRT